MIELLWDPPAAAGPRARQRLSLDQVVDGGHGGGRRATASRRCRCAVGPSSSGVGAMTLYTYVPGQAELFELMIDRA